MTFLFKELKMGSKITSIGDLVDKYNNVNAPAHYNKNGEIECIDAIKEVLGQEGFESYLQGQIVKYIWRSDVKGGAEDIRKLIWYARRLLAEIDGES
jgi:hypothetical protein